MGDAKKNLFDKAIDALTNRDEKEAAVKAQAETAAAQKETAALRAQVEAQQAAAARAASEKATAERAAALKAAAEKAAAEQAAALKAAAEKAAAAPKQGVVTTRSLRVRKDHNTTSEVVAGLVDGNEITILETWSNGQNTWARLENGWAAMLYNGESYIKFLQ